jgi:hypothetical protein
VKISPLKLAGEFGLTSTSAKPLAAGANPTLSLTFAEDARSASQPDRDLRERVVCAAGDRAIRRGNLD